MHVAYSATENFNIRLLVGADSNPPTTPTLSSTVPASVSQINLSWTTSTDNVAVLGYQVFRNASQIATTSLTSYFDSGLNANTLYTYSVRAFDTSFNYSSTSNTLATTTLTPTATTTSSSGGGGGSSGSKSTVLQEFSVSPLLYSALFTWKTSTFVKFDLRWGRTSSYELGYISDDVVKREHTTVVTDLVPSTVYEYELTAFDSDGKQIRLKSGQFKTRSLRDTVAPTNVQNLKAKVVGDSVVLSWVNPQDTDFGKVRIVRSYLFYPTDSADGFVAYQGSDETFTDAEAFREIQKMYYTVFSYDMLGNISSGAVVEVTKDKKYVPTLSNTDAPDSPYVLSFTDLEFIQDGKQVGLAGLDATEAFSVRIAYHKLPEHLKTITVTLRSGKQIDTTYLLRINNNKTFYEALIAPFTQVGPIDVFSTVYDFKTKTMQTVSGVVSFYSPTKNTQNTFPFQTTYAIESPVATFAMIFFLTLCVFIFFFFFKRKKP